MAESRSFSGQYQGMRGSPIPEGYLAAYANVGKSIQGVGDEIAGAIDNYVKKRDDKERLVSAIGANLQSYYRVLDLEDREAGWYPAEKGEDGRPKNNKKRPTFGIRDTLDRLGDASLSEIEGVYGALENKLKGVGERLKMNEWESDIVRRDIEAAGTATAPVGDVGGMFKPKSGKPDDIRAFIENGKRALQSGALTPVQRKAIEEAINANQRILDNSQITTDRVSKVEQEVSASEVDDQSPYWSAIDQGVEPTQAGQLLPAGTGPIARGPRAPEQPTGPVTPSVGNVVAQARERAATQTPAVGPEILESRQVTERTVAPNPIPNPFLERNIEQENPDSEANSITTEESTSVTPQDGQMSSTAEAIPLEIPDNYAPPAAEKPKPINLPNIGGTQPTAPAPAAPISGLTNVAGQPSPVAEAAQRVGAGRQAPTESQRVVANAASGIAPRAPTAATAAPAATSAPAAPSARAQAAQSSDPLYGNKTVGDALSDPNIKPEAKYDLAKRIAEGQGIKSETDEAGFKTFTVTGAPALPPELQIDQEQIDALRANGFDDQKIELYVQEREKLALAMARTEQQRARFEEAQRMASGQTLDTSGPFSILAQTSGSQNPIAEGLKRIDELVAEANKTPDEPWVSEIFGEKAGKLAVAGALTARAALNLKEQWDSEKLQIKTDSDAERARLNAQAQTGKAYADNWDEQKVNAAKDAAEKQARKSVEARAKDKSGNWRKGWGPQRLKTETAAAVQRATDSVERTAYVKMAEGRTPVFQKGWSQARVDKNFNAWFNKTYGDKAAAWSRRSFASLPMHRIVAEWKRMSTGDKMALGGKALGALALVPIALDLKAGFGGPYTGEGSYSKNVALANRGGAPVSKTYAQVEADINRGRQIRALARNVLAQIPAPPAAPATIETQGTQTAQAPAGTAATSVSAAPAAPEAQGIQAPTQAQPPKPVGTQIVMPERGKVGTAVLIRQTSDALQKDGTVQFNLYGADGRVNQMVHQMAYRRNIDINSNGLQDEATISKLKGVLGEVFMANVDVAADGTVTMTGNERSELEYNVIDPSKLSTFEQRQEQANRNAVIQELERRGVPATATNIEYAMRGRLVQGGVNYEPRFGSAGVTYGKPLNEAPKAPTAKEIVDLRRAELGLAKEVGEVADLAVGEIARDQTGTPVIGNDGKAVIAKPLAYNAREVRTNGQPVKDEFLVAGNYADKTQKAEMDKRLQASQLGLATLHKARIALHKMAPDIVDAEGNWTGVNRQLTTAEEQEYRVAINAIVRAMSEGLGPLAGNDYRFVFEGAGIPQTIFDYLGSGDAASLQAAANYLADNVFKSNTAFLARVHERLDGALRQKALSVQSSTSNNVRVMFRNNSTDDNGSLLAYDNVRDRINKQFDAIRTRELVRSSSGTGPRTMGVVEEAYAMFTSPSQFLVAFPRTTTTEIRQRGLEIIAAKLGYDVEHVLQMMQERSQAGRNANNRPIR